MQIKAPRGLRLNNNSTHNTVRAATDASGTVRRVALQGKGNVIWRMFVDVEADIYN